MATLALKGTGKRDHGKELVSAVSTTLDTKTCSRYSIIKRNYYKMYPHGVEIVQELSD